MAKILEKKQFFQLYALKFLLLCREDYCLNNGLSLVKSRDADRLGFLFLFFFFCFGGGGRG